MRAPVLLKATSLASYAEVNIRAGDGEGDLPHKSYSYSLVLGLVPPSCVVICELILSLLLPQF